MTQNTILDIDKFLEDNAVTIRLHGKEFTVKDIDNDAQQLMAKDEKDQSESHGKDIVKALLKCTDEDLEGYGSVAMAAIMKEITENLLLQPSQQNQSTD